MTDFTGRGEPGQSSGFYCRNPPLHWLVWNLQRGSAGGQRWCCLSWWVSDFWSGFSFHVSVWWDNSNYIEMTLWSETPRFWIGAVSNDQVEREPGCVWGRDTDMLGWGTLNDTMQSGWRRVLVRFSLSLLLLLLLSLLFSLLFKCHTSCKHTRCMTFDLTCSNKQILKKKF